MVSPFRRDRWPIWIGGALGVAILVWLLRDLDVPRLIKVVRDADPRPLLLLPLAVVAEQLVRAVKWRILLAPVCTVSAPRLFSAIMVGYLVHMAVPVAASSLVRAWLVARAAAQKVSTVLATIVIDRLVDGWVYLGIAAAIATAISIPDAEGTIQDGLWKGIAGVLAALAAMAALLLSIKRMDGKAPRFLAPVVRRLPARLTRLGGEVAGHFGRGVVLPGGAGGYLAVFGAAVVMKALAISHFFWAGMAFGVVLAPLDYVFLMVFLGFLAAVAGSLRIVGGFAAGAVYVLGLYGVAPEQALAMALIVQISSHLTTAVAGIFCLFAEDIGFNELRQMGRKFKDWREGEGT